MIDTLEILFDLEMIRGFADLLRLLVKAHLSLHGLTVESYIAHSDEIKTAAEKFIILSMRYCEFMGSPGINLFTRKTHAQCNT